MPPSTWHSRAEVEPSRELAHSPTDAFAERVGGRVNDKDHLKLHLQSHWSYYNTMLLLICGSFFLKLTQTRK